MATQNVPVSVMNAKIMEEIDNDNIKSAQSAATNYTRTTIREDSFMFKILPPEKATNDMLDRDLTERLQIIWEIEPDSPAAKWVPLQTVPEGEYITGSRYAIPFARVITPKFQKDLDELRTTRQDIRKILTDNSIKDGLAEIDTKGMETINSIVFNSAGSGEANTVTGKVQWLDFTGEINRANFAEACKMLPEGCTFTGMRNKFRLNNHICLMNDKTALDFAKLGRDAVGGDLSQEMFENGMTINKIMGVNAMFTIKDDLVPDDYIYFFAAPEFLGKAFYLTDWTMFMKKEAWFIEMYSYWLGGFAFGNVAGMAVARFNQSV